VTPPFKPLLLSAAAAGAAAAAAAAALAYVQADTQTTLVSMTQHKHAAHQLLSEYCYYLMSTRHKITRHKSNDMSQHVQA
jgi:hypothetical protein